MKVTVIIPTLNEELYVGKLLDDIACQSYKVHETIVVDGHSEDKTADIVHKIPGVKLLQTSRSVGHQRNYGGTKAKGDLLIFLDADAHITKDFVKKIIEAIQNSGATIAIPQYIPYPGSPGINAFYGFFNKLFKFSEKYQPSGAGGCIIVTRKLFKLINGFKKEYTFDDLFFIREASKKGTFKVFDFPVYVSDRRIRKYGLPRIVVQYFVLSVLFMFGAFKLTNHVKYSFGIFKSTTSSSKK